MRGALVAVHLVAMACGIAAALRADLGVAVALRAGHVGPDVVRLVRRASTFVWSSMAVLIASGTGFLLTGSPATDRMWTKLLVVGVACTNGRIIHRSLLPELRNLARSGARPARSFLQRAGAAGGVSAASWLSAVALGAWRSLELAVPALVAVYLGAATVAASIGMWLAPVLSGQENSDAGRPTSVASRSSSGPRRSCKPAMATSSVAPAARLCSRRSSSLRLIERGISGFSRRLTGP